VYEGIGSSTGWEGCSFWDFYDFLPGVYWLNVFSQELSVSLKLNQIENTSYLSNDEGLTIFFMKDDFLSEEISERLKLQSEIIKIIGEEYIFDIKEKDTVKIHHNDFKKYLENLNQ
jgi:hypothetical protein